MNESQPKLDNPIEKIDAKAPLPSCSIFETAKISLETSEGSFCNFCYEICKKGELQITGKHFNILNKCSCNHDGP